MRVESVGRRKRSAWQLLLVAIAALPFAASLGFDTVGRTPRLPKGAAARPALVFDQYLVNLGEIHNAPQAKAEFRFKNCGLSPVRITNLEPSCGCLHPKLEKRSYLPGEICEFELGVWTTRERPGPHEYELTIDYEDPLPHTVTVAMKVIIRREVTVRPSQLLFYQNGTDEAEQKAVITDMRVKPFLVTGATCKSPLVKVAVGKPIDDVDGGRATAVSITVAPQVPTGGADTTIVLTTDDPHYPRIPIAIMIRDVHARLIQQTSGQGRASPPPRAKP